MAAARLAVPVAPAVQREYDERVGRTAAVQGGGKTIVNQLSIERAAHHPHTGVPYLPGSSIKGAIRTAWLNQLNAGATAGPGEKANRLETRLLQGAFHTDPFRFLAVSDAMGQDVLSEIVFSTNHKKRLVLSKSGQPLAAKGPTTRREAIVAAQYAALVTDVTVQRPQIAHVPDKLPDPQRRLNDWRSVAGACNAYYLPRLHAELDLLDERRLAAPQWTQGVRQLLRQLEAPLAAGDAVLLRIGRHSGFENVTLDGARQLRTGAKASTTLWLAAREENARSEMLPFGWVLLHRRDRPLQALQQWCDNLPKPDVTVAREQLRQLREALQAQRAAAEQAEAERRAAAQRAQEAAAQEAARLAALTPEGQEVEALRKLLLGHTAARKQPVSGQLYQRTRALIQRAEQDGTWSAQDKAALAELLTTLVPEKIDLAGKAKEIRQAAQRLGAST
ncbi:MAG: RAMP superfamily CRISPR-associated protein [Tepidimonas sp.]|nr:RAMP superfamily CRISPR-associated protein [Tepidimonas sp.]MDM7455818.1 RAMP superfamily CRISPR-associated protein [Tepidimonas sp.]